jgi:hypothetical protein
MLMSVIASEADIERRAFARPLRANWMTNEQVIVDDVLTSKIFVDQPAQKVLLEAEVRAVISTPLRSSKGNLLGVIFIEPDRSGSVLKFRWQESGGPPVSPPARQGFGTQLLKGIFSNLSLEYPVEGLTSSRRCK